jgi:hypothetical protein
MKRKTNLFYNAASQDSSFLTFSNYTESLTGNIMSTDNKIYPSTFLCFQLDGLNNTTEASKYYDTIQERNKNNTGYTDILQTTILDCWVTGGNDIVKVYTLNIDGKEYELKEGTEITYDMYSAFFYTYPNGDVVLKEYQTIDGEETEIGSDILNIDSNMGADTTGESHDIIIKRTYQYEKTSFDISDSNEVYVMNKQRLIDKLICKYENKLATLRDWCVSNDQTQESTLLPLNYLLETIADYEGKEVTDLDINCIGDVTEQDWNGTFSDTICVIDTSKYKKGTVEENSDIVTTTTDDLSESPSYLHGWYVTKHDYNEELDFDNDGVNSLSISEDATTNQLYSHLLKDKDADWLKEFKRTHYITDGDSDDYNAYFAMYPEPDEDDIQNYSYTLQEIIKAAEIQEIYKGPSASYNLVPEFDTTTYQYTTSSLLSKINYDWNSSTNTSLKFNVLIPLFDLVDVNYDTNSTRVEETTYMTLQNGSDPEMMVKNVPYGIWFSGENSVVLNADKNTNTWPSWSLSLASQFKPFPNSSYMPSEITADAKKLAFATFAQIASRQNDILDKVETLSTNLSYLSTRVSSLESKIGAVLNSYNLDNFRMDIANYKNEINNQITYLTSTIDELTIQWVNREG